MTTKELAHAIWHFLYHGRDVVPEPEELAEHIESDPEAAAVLEEFHAVAEKVVKVLPKKPRKAAAKKAVVKRAVVKKRR